jgi:hypothetical protein
MAEAERELTAEEKLAREVLGDNQVRDYGIKPCVWVRATPGVECATIKWQDAPTNKDLHEEGNGGFKFAGYKLTRLRQERTKWSEKGVVELGPNENEYLCENLMPDRHFKFEVRPFVRTFVRREILGEPTTSKSVIVNKRLPDGWVTIRSVDGGCHFYNVETKESVAEEPDPNDLYFLPTELAVKFTQEQREEMLECFLDYDEDRGGSLDEEELREVLDDLELKLPEKKLKKLFEELDADGSGELEYREFVQLCWMVQKGAEGLVRRAKHLSRGILNTPALRK